MILPTVEIKKILFATDLSEHAKHAFAYAVSLANLYQVGLTIVHVIAEDPELDAKIVGHISAAQWESIKNQHFNEAREALIGKRREGSALRDVLGQFCEDVQNNNTECSFKTDDIIVLRGHPGKEILKVAESHQCDLIVMGRHGYGVIRDALLGGTARHVLRRSQVPVLLIRLPANDELHIR